MMEINRDNYFRLLNELESLRSHPEDFDYGQGYYVDKGCIDCLCAKSLGLEHTYMENGRSIVEYLNISTMDALWLWSPSRSNRDGEEEILHFPFFPMFRTPESLEYAILKVKHIGKKYNIESFQPNETAFLTELKDSLELVGK